MKNLQRFIKIEALEERFEMTVASIDSARCLDDVDGRIDIDIDIN